MTEKQIDFLMKYGAVLGVSTLTAVVVWISLIAPDRKEWREFPQGETIKRDTMLVLSVQYQPKFEKNTCYIMDDAKHDRFVVMRAASDIKCPFVRPMDSVVVKTTKRPCGLLSRKIVENLTTGRKMKEYQPQR